MKGWWQTLALAAGLLVSSCTSTRIVPVEVHHTDTLWRTNVQRDSIVLHDSIVEKQKGDTVLLERWHTRYVKKEVHDTTYVATHDTIPQPYPVEVIKKVEKPLTWWQQTRMHIGGITVWLLLLVGLGMLLKKRWRL